MEILKKQNKKTINKTSDPIHKKCQMHMFTGLYIPADFVLSQALVAKIYLSWSNGCMSKAKKHHRINSYTLSYLVLLGHLPNL